MKGKNKKDGRRDDEVKRHDNERLIGRRINKERASLSVKK